MSNDRMAGLALIVGSVGVIVTLSLHPSGHDLFNSDTYAVAARNTIAVHSLALLSMPVWLAGAWGLARRLASKCAAAYMGLSFYGFAMAAMMTAVVFDGLVSPGLAGQINATTGTVGQGWRIAFNYNGMLDLGFMRVFLVASSIAIVLWCVAIVRDRVLGMGLGIYGLILGVVTVGLSVSGFINRSPHIFGMVIVGQVFWFVVAGIMLYRSAPTQ